MTNDTRRRSSARDGVSCLDGSRNTASASGFDVEVILNTPAIRSADLRHCQRLLDYRWHLATWQVSSLPSARLRHAQGH